jgi:hypothetical protein
MSLTCHSSFCNPPLTPYLTKLKTKSLKKTNQVLILQPLLPPILISYHWDPFLAPPGHMALLFLSSQLPPISSSLQLLFFWSGCSSFRNTQSWLPHFLQVFSQCCLTRKVSPDCPTRQDNLLTLVSYPFVTINVDWLIPFNDMLFYHQNTSPFT